MPKLSRQTMPPSNDLEEGPLTPKAITKMEFGRRLQHLMIQKGWNQSELARQADMGRDSISHYINGRSFPTPGKLQALADALGVNRDQLLPNGMMEAMDAEHPAIDLKQAAGHPGKAWLRINRALPFDVATQIIVLINESDARSE